MDLVLIHRRSNHPCLPKREEPALQRPGCLLQFAEAAWIGKNREKNTDWIEDNSHDMCI